MSRLFYCRNSYINEVQIYLRLSAVYELLNAPHPTDNSYIKHLNFCFVKKPKKALHKTLINENVEPPDQ